MDPKPSLPSESALGVAGHDHPARRTHLTVSLAVAQAQMILRGEQPDDDDVF
jgi:hypothetical protein